MSVESFDAVAESYDRCFTETVLGRELRAIVWSTLEGIFRRGDRVLELNCGTGEDAVWLASRGIKVFATDSSRAMLEVAAQKAASTGISGNIEFSHLNLAKPAVGWPDSEFDGALSNFGGLNCIRDMTDVAGLLGRSIRPGGRFIAVVMGRWCAWEILWHLLHFQPRAALRRLAQPGTKARIGSGTLRVWYPPPGALRRALGHDFRLKRLRGLGVFLPPTYLQEVVAKRRRLFDLLCMLEKSLGSSTPMRYLGDHILFDFERIPLTSRDR